MKLLWAHRPLFLLALVLPLMSCERESSPSDFAAGGPARPDVVLIVFDALRADRLGAYGHDSRLTPAMDGIAAEGVLFEHCIAAAPWTLPSIASLFVSRYPAEHGAVSYRAVSSMERGVSAYQSVLANEFDTLAELLERAGYQTAGFCANTFIRSRYGFGQGFEHFDSDFAANTVRGEIVNRSALGWLSRHRDRDRPLFLYLHYMDVHGPYDAAPRFLDPLLDQVEKLARPQHLSDRELGAINAYLRHPPAEDSAPIRFERLGSLREYWVARYEAGVREADHYLALLVNGLEAAGVWNDAYVILISDHGEALCEHGYWDHGYSLHQTDLHVPLIMRWPGVLPAGERIGQLVSLIDLLPTLGEQLGLPLPDGVQGSSMIGHLDGRPTDTTFRLAEAVKSGPAQVALYEDQTKLMVTLVNASSGEKGVVARLYDIAEDPGETHDLSGERQQAAHRMLERLRTIIANRMSVAPIERAPVDDETASRLRGLGYTDDGGTTH